MAKSPEELTKQWIEQFVIKLNLCPFAAVPMRKGRVRIVSCEAQDFDKMMDHFLAEALLLMENEATDISTSLIVYPVGLDEFGDFLDFKATVLDLCEDAGLDQFIQLADFHPDYIFANVPESDPANATNRSPYPTLHLLRVEEMSEAIANYPDVDQIPQRNIDLLRKLAKKHEHDLGRPH